MWKKTATSHRPRERRVVREVTTSGTETFQYDTIGRLTRRTDRLGRITELSYNGRDQVATERWLDASGTVSRMINFAYNSWGELLTVGDASHSYSYLYDQLGRVTDAIYAINGFTLVNGVTPSVKLSHTNNLASERTLVKTYLGAAPDYYENIYDLDALGRWKSVTQRDDTNIISNLNPDAVIDKHVVFSYGAPGNVNSISRYARTPTADVGIASTSITYTNNGQLDIITHTLTANGNVINGYDLQYDTANRLDAVAAIPGSPFATETVDFAYDLAGQLTQANDNDGNLADNELYSYDSNGNRDKQNPNGTGTPIYGNHNRLMTDEVFDYTYDAEGNLKSRTTRVGLNNRVKWEYDWDHRNRMTEARLYDLQNGAALTKTIRYDYDAMNQLIRKQVFTEASSNQAFFVYDQGQVALQFDGPALQTVSHRYLWGPAVDQLLAVDDVSHGTSAERKVHWALSDHLGTIRDIVSHNATSPATTSSTHRTYDTFGNVLSTDGSAAMTDVVFGFTGRMFDSDTSLQNNLHRWYDPNSGRWINEDPIRFAAGDANLYRYVGNEPTNHVDPDGLEERDLTAWRQHLLDVYLSAQREVDAQSRSEPEPPITIVDGSLFGSSIHLNDSYFAGRPFGTPTAVCHGVTGTGMVGPPNSFRFAAAADQLRYYQSLRDTSAISTAIVGGILSVYALGPTTAGMSIPGVGSQAVLPVGFGGRAGVAGLRPALYINGRVYVHYIHVMA